MRRYERVSTLPTSNRPVDDWGNFLLDTAAVTALLDRLLHHAHDRFEGLILSGSGAVTSRVRRRHVTLVDVCIDDGLRARNHHLFPRLISWPHPDIEDRVVAIRR